MKCLQKYLRNKYIFYRVLFKMEINTFGFNFFSETLNYFWYVILFGLRLQFSNLVDDIA